MDWGYVDEWANWAIEPAWINAGTFCDGLAWVEQDGKLGYIDRGGKLAIEPQFTSCAQFSGGLAEVERSPGVPHVIDRSGRAVFSKREASWLGVSPVARWDGMSKMLWGVADTDAQVVVPLEYQWIKPSDQFVIARDFDSTDHVFDLGGKHVFERRSATAFMSTVLRVDERWVVAMRYDAAGHILIMDDRLGVLHELEGDSIRPITAGNSCYQVSFFGKRERHYYDAAFERVEAPLFSQANTGARVEQTRRKHHLFLNDIEVDVGPFDDTTIRLPLVWVMQKAGKERRWGAVNDHGELVIPIEHTSRWFGGPYCVLGAHGKVGLVDAEGIWVIQPQYTALRLVADSPNGRAAAYVGGKALKSGTLKGGVWALLDLAGERISDADFAELGSVYSQGVLAAATA